MSDLIATPAATLFDYQPETVAAMIRPTDPRQVTVFDAIAEAEAAPAVAPAFDPEAYFDLIWNGEATGFSEAKIRADLADSERTLEDLNAKRITPRRVIGAGYKKPLTLARAYLTGRINEAKRDLATRGRTNSVNIANVRYNAPAGHPLKDHRPSYKASDKYGHLWQATCSCGWHECGYSAVTTWTGHSHAKHVTEATG